MTTANHRLLKILSRFDIKSWKRCRLFVEMELAGQNPLEIYDHLMATRKKSATWKLEALYTQVLIGSSKKTIQNELSRLTQAVESYISYLELKEEPQYKDLLLRQYYLRESDHKEWESSFMKSLEVYNKIENISFLDQYDLMRILHQAYFNTHPIKKRYVIDILHQLQESSGLTQSAYRSYVRMVYNHESDITQNPQSQLPLTLNTTLNEELFNKIDLLSNDYHLNLLQEILLILEELGTKLDAEIKIVCYGKLQNIMLRQVSKNNPLVSAGAIVDVMMAELNYMDQAQIPVAPEKLYRCVTYLNYDNRVEAMAELVSRYATKMKGDGDYDLCRSMLLVSKGQISEAIALLNSISTNSFTTKFLIRNQLIRAYCIYYDDKEFCLSEINKFKLWVKSNNENLSNNVSAALLNSMDILTDILRHKPLAGILQKVHADQPLSGRMWLKKEISERYHLDNPL